jgi:hypothetical protein
MAAAEQQAWGNMVRLQRERPGFVAEVLDRVRTDGPLKAGALLEGKRERSGEMWDWHAGKVALEWLFFTGEVTATHRTTSFEKVYDLTERVLPAEVLRTPTPDPADAVRELVRTAARALGVATERDLRDYFRIRPEAARTAIAELAREEPGTAVSTLDRAAELVMPRRHELKLADVNPRYLDKILLKTYERAPRDFEELLGIEGVGPKTLRALALVAELIYGTPASTRDPARYAFAHGGKDGTPFPVDRRTYDRTIDVLNGALNAARVDRSERVKAFARLARFGDKLGSQ